MGHLRRALSHREFTVWKSWLRPSRRGPRAAGVNRRQEARKEAVVAEWPRRAPCASSIVMVAISAPSPERGAVDGAAIAGEGRGDAHRQGGEERAHAPGRVDEAPGHAQAGAPLFVASAMALPVQGEVADQASRRCSASAGRRQEMIAFPPAVGLTARAARRPAWAGVRNGWQADPSLSSLARWSVAGPCCLSPSRSRAARPRRPT